MKRLTIIFLSIFMLITYSKAQDKTASAEFVPPGGARLMVQVDGKDTVFLAFLHDLWVYPRNTFKNKKQEQFFWRTVRDVKKTLPYAKLLSSELRIVNMKLVDMKNEKEKKKFISQYEKELFKKHEADLKKMTVNQGRMLMKLVDRECERTSYDLIKDYKGTFTAVFWQGVARLFGSNLKSEYQANGEDKIVERVINLVEAGQL